VEYKQHCEKVDAIVLLLHSFHRDTQPLETMMSLSSLALRTACRSSCRAALFASSFPLPAETPITAIDKLHQVIETFRMTK
jgi:hypothetical protein